MTTAPKLAAKLGVPYSTLAGWRDVNLLDEDRRPGHGHYLTYSPTEAAWVEFLTRIANLLGRGHGKGQRRTGAWWAIATAVRTRPVTGPLLLVVPGRHLLYAQDAAEALRLATENGGAVVIPVPSELVP